MISTDESSGVTHAERPCFWSVEVKSSNLLDGFITNASNRGYSRHNRRKSHIREQCVVKRGHRVWGAIGCRRQNKACKARAPLKNRVMPLRDLKRAAVSRSAKPMALALGESCNEADVCFRARPSGRSARFALCVATPRQV